ncbi:MAG: SRPBCC domain-containing protein [Vicinamibacterales bacterium]
MSTRLFRAPRANVVRAFTDPALLVQWWGPKGFTNVFEEFDQRPGGLWRFVMHGPDGSEFRLTKEFIDVAPPERIVLRQLGGLHQFRMTMDFVEDGDATRVTWLMQFDSAEEGERVRPFVTAANEENFDRLETLLASMA